MKRTMAVLPLLPIVLILRGVSPLAADGIEGFFDTPTTEVAQQETESLPPVLLEYQQSQDKMRFSFDLNSTGGAYIGWTGTPDFSDPSLGFSHLSGAAINLTSSLDLRPFDYFRLHGSFIIAYPTASGSTWDFSAPTLSELFFDYATPGLVALRLGRFSLAWGNARILTAANLPGRTVDASVLASTVDIRPAWIEGSNPSLWLKAALPLGSLALTGLAGLPSTVGTGLSQMGYGGLAEYVIGKTCLSLAGYYKSDKVPRLAAMAKTSGWGADLFIDSSLAFPEFPGIGTPLAVVTGGFYYQTDSVPDIRVSAEVRYNGENEAGTGTLVADALAIGGLSSAAVLVWRAVGGSPVTLGGTWYQSWEDRSGAVVPYLSVGIMPLVSVKAIFPLVYGAAGSEYRNDPPAEAGGFVAAVGLFVVLSTSF